MAKYRKTREDKITASFKRQQLQHEFTYSLNTLTPAKPIVPIHLGKKFIQTPTNALKDVKKTCLISSTLIASELILFLLLHQHIVRVPFAQY